MSSGFLKDFSFKWQKLQDHVPSPWLCSWEASASQAWTHAFPSTPWPLMAWISSGYIRWRYPLWRDSSLLGALARSFLTEELFFQKEEAAWLWTSSGEGWEKHNQAQDNELLGYLLSCLVTSSSENICEKEIDSLSADLGLGLSGLQKLREKIENEEGLALILGAGGPEGVRLSYEIRMAGGPLLNGKTGNEIWKGLIEGKGLWRGEGGLAEGLWRSGYITPWQMGKKLWHSTGKAERFSGADRPSMES